MRTVQFLMIVAIGIASSRGIPPVWAGDAPASSQSPSVAPADDNAMKDNAPKKAPPESPSPASVTVIDSGYARAILGRDVRSPTDENMGRIADVIVDRGGQVRAAVIDFGGFLGVGSRKIAVAWNALQFSNVANKGQSTTLELTRDQVKAAPEYKDDQPIVVLGASGTLEPIRFRPLAADK